MVQITAFFAGLLALFYFVLSLNVVFKRRNLRLKLGDGNDELLACRIRAHANFAEYVPITLILMLVNELNGMTGLLLFCLGVIFTFGRLCHSYSLTQAELKTPPTFFFRKIGMITTFVVLIVLSCAAIWKAVMTFIITVTN